MTITPKELSADMRTTQRAILEFSDEVESEFRRKLVQDAPERIKGYLENTKAMYLVFTPNSDGTISVSIPIRMLDIHQAKIKQARPWADGEKPTSAKLNEELSSMLNAYLEKKATLLASKGMQDLAQECYVARQLTNAISPLQADLAAQALEFAKKFQHHESTLMASQSKRAYKLRKLVETVLVKIGIMKPSEQAQAPSASLIKKLDTETVSFTKARRSGLTLQHSKRDERATQTTSHSPSKSPKPRT